MEKCAYQLVASKAEKTTALRLGRCEMCSGTEGDLRTDGQKLEVYGVEHYTDFATGETIVLAIPLCNDCHQQQHINAQMVREPCPFVALQSREVLT